MHCIVPFAAPPAGSEAGRAAMATMQWPLWSRLLPRLAVVARDEGEATSFTPPHERVLAHALGWPGHAGAPAADGCWPFAARAARADGVDAGQARGEAAAGRPWGLVSPVHWHVGTDQVSLADPLALQLDDAASRRFFAALAPLFAEEGITFAYGHATRWYAADESLQGLATASLDRVVGRNVDAWLGGAAAGSAPHRRWRRLQAEAQMLLHNHPLNAEREARGLLPVNSFWLSGCGRALPEVPPAGEPAAHEVQVEPILRGAALAEDWAAWAAAWGRLEAGTLQAWQTLLERGAVVRLTLAGERAAVTLAPAAGGVLSRMKQRWSAPTVPELLQGL